MEDFVDVPTYDPDHNGIMRRRRYGEYVNIEDYFKLLDAYRLLLPNQATDTINELTDKRISEEYE